jgi:hypothetical protein
MKRAKTEPEDMLRAIATVADDGFCATVDLTAELPRMSYRDLVRLRKRAARRGLILERRAPDGRIYLALSTEGWRELRASPALSAQRKLPAEGKPS